MSVQRMRCLISLLITSALCDSGAAADPPDYLSEPVASPIYAHYHGLIQKKLVISSADFGQIVFIPPFSGEGAMSVYKAENDDCFRITAVDAKRSLSAARANQAEAAPVQRTDVDIDAELAAAIQRALRAVLAHEPIPKPDYEPNMQLDGSMYLFSVRMPDGSHRTRATGDSDRAPASELIELANQIWSYCHMPPESRRDGRGELLRRLTSFAEQWEKA